LTLSFDIDSSQLPEEVELRDKLFPGWLAVSTDDQELRIISRRAFPPLVSPSDPSGQAALQPLAKAAAEALKAAAARRAAAAPATPATATASPSTAPGGMYGQSGPAAAGGRPTGRRRRDD
jgi:hypothetical protein